MKIRNKKQFFFFISDICLIQVALFLSFYLRFEGALPEEFFQLYGRLILPITLIKLGTFVANGLYKKVWRYANVDEMFSIMEGILIASILFVGYVFFFRISFPRSIIIIDMMLTLIMVGGFRFFLRLLEERKIALNAKKHARNVLIIGAGDAGELVLREFQKHKELNTQIIGFIDDDPTKLNLEIHSVKVLGNRTKISQIVERYGVQEVIIAIPSASGKEIRELHQLCSSLNIGVRTLPGVYEIINGNVILSQIREVQVEDLLGREAVEINMVEVAAFLTGKRILITGGGGSIGSELCRQVAKFHPEQLIIYDIGENNVYDIDLNLRESFKNLEIVPVIGSIQDENRLRETFQRYKPHIVFHAAAHKHVPLMEYNPEEAVKNNIFGTRNVAYVAHDFNVERFVMISTDKAINPTNVMGATKRVAEMIIQDLNRRSKTKFVAVRFGNVLGSRGSVIPLFKQQIAKGGPITVTHQDITRYFMTIPEASQLVIQAGVLGQGGEVFILDMGKPVKIMNLAKDIIELSGLKVGEDIEIKITGLRPGEKLYEELLSEKEGTFSTQHERILIAKLENVDSELLAQSMKQMEQMVKSPHPNYLVKELVKLVANFIPSSLHESVSKKEA